MKIEYCISIVRYTKMEDFPFKRLFLTKGKIYLHNIMYDNTLLTVIRKDKIITEFCTSSHSYWKANVITDIYTEYARVRANVIGFLSPYKMWHVEKRYIKKMCRIFYTEITKKTLRETIFKLSKEATTFNCILSKAVYDNFLPLEGGNVLDPFSGWGDRAIGAIASNRVLRYDGVDSNSNLIKGYQELMNDLDTKNKITLTISKFQDYTSKHNYDLIFTSPPYYDYERYQETDWKNYHSMPHLSHQTHSATYHSWFCEMELCMINMVDMLKINGYLILHIGKTYRTPRMDNDFIDALKELGMKMVQKIDCTSMYEDKKKRSVPLWIFRKML